MSLNHPGVTTTNAILGFGAAMVAQGQARRQQRIEEAREIADARAVAAIARQVQDLLTENAALRRRLATQTDRAIRAENAAIAVARRRA